MSNEGKKKLKSYFVVACHSGTHPIHYNPLKLQTPLAIGRCNHCIPPLYFRHKPPNTCFIFLSWAKAFTLLSKVSNVALFVSNMLDALFSSGAEHNNIFPSFDPSKFYRSETYINTTSCNDRISSWNNWSNNCP